MGIFLYAETGQQGCGIAFGIPSFKFGEFLFEFSCLYAVFVREIGFGIYGVFLLHYVPKHSVTAQNSLYDRALVKLEVVLRKHGKAFSGSESHRTLRRS